MEKIIEKNTRVQNIKVDISPVDFSSGITRNLKGDVVQKDGENDP